MRLVVRRGVAVEKLAHFDFAEIASRQEALQTIFPLRLDILYHPNFGFFLKRRVFQQPQDFPTPIRPNRCLSRHCLTCPLEWRGMITLRHRFSNPATSVSTLKIIGSSVLFLLLAWGGRSDGKGNLIPSQRTKYSASIPMSSEQVSLDGLCINFNASMNSSEFNGLERVETASGTVFRRSKKVVSKFPDVIDVRIWAIPYLCNSRDRGKQPKDLGMDAVDALTFRFSWKHDFELRPAQTIDFKKMHFPKSNSWLFYSEVRGTEIPLDYHAI